MLWLLLVATVISATLLLNVTVLDQSNVLERWPNTTQRLRVQNISDIAGQPLLVVADDALVPLLGDCVSLTLVFSAIRIKFMSNPRSLTVVLMRDNNSAPGLVLYQKSLPWASNDDNWMQSRGHLGSPWPYEVTLRRNELGDDGVTRLDLAALGGARLWVAFYCTGAQQLSGGYYLNAMFWVAQSATANATPLVAGNPEFYFRDPNNLLGDGLTQWTSATRAQRSPKIGQVAPTNQMAWRLFFTCAAAPETREPSAAPSVAPTAAPTRETLVPETPSSNWTNFTGAAAPGNTVALAVALPFALLGTLLGAFLVWRVARRRAPDEQQSSQVPERQAQFAEYAEIPLEPLRRPEVRLSRTTDAFIESLYDSGVHTASEGEEI